jgi:hypothetical protein
MSMTEQAAYHFFAKPARVGSRTLWRWACPTGLAIVVVELIRERVRSVRVMYLLALNPDPDPEVMGATSNPLLNSPASASFPALSGSGAS